MSRGVNTWCRGGANTWCRLTSTSYSEKYPAFLVMMRTILNPAVVSASVALVAVLVYAAAHIRDHRSIDETAGRTRLVEALARRGESGVRSPFEDVLVTLHLPHSDVHVSDGKGQDDKYFALPVLQRKGRD